MRGDAREAARFVKRWLHQTAATPFSSDWLQLAAPLTLMKKPKVGRIFSTRFRDTLETLGVDPLKDAEAYHIARLGPGRHVYGGWYHFIGRLTADGDFGVVDFGNGFTAWLCKATAPRLETLEGWSAVQLEFHSEAVSWMLSEPEPV